VALGVAILIVLAAAAVAVLALVLVYKRAHGPLLLDSGRGRPIVNVTGTLFTVVLAFVILSAFQTYDGARSGAAAEANAVLEMTRDASLFPASQRDRLRSDLVCYGRAVVSAEWPAMRRGRSSPLVDYWIGAYRAVIDHLEVHSLRQQAGFQDLLTQGSSRTTGRQQRLGDDTPTVPTPLWVTLIFGACISIALTLGMADPREKLHVFAPMLAGLTAVVVAGLLVVYFLDHPYAQHVGGIQPTAMRHALVMLHNQEPGLRPGCRVGGRPV
jgi:Protein of unknown function (DUF4239)